MLNMMNKIDKINRMTIAMRNMKKMGRIMKKMLGRVSSMCRKRIKKIYWKEDNKSNRRNQGKLSCDGDFRICIKLIIYQNISSR
jgi:hypothetical protein